jgi:hypothetical protein
MALPIPKTFFIKYCANFVQIYCIFQN